MEKLIEDSLDLCIPIYLNQQIVFDLLAIIEDGLSDVTTIKTSIIDSERKSASAGSTIGLSNLLSLFGVSFSGSLNQERDTDEQTELSKKKIHTPSSLFSKLRICLKEKGLVHELLSIEDFNKLESGMFVEFKAILTRNPLIDSIERITQLMEMALPLIEEETHPSIKGKRKENTSQNKNENEILLSKIKGLSTELNNSKSTEIIGQIVGGTKISAVLSAKSDFFINQNMEELIDGEYRIFGKVIRTIPLESTVSINLLRKTSLGLLNKQFIDEFCKILEGIQEQGVEIPEMVTEIKKPAIQVIPISIFT
ncbi:peptidylprolyl isomerase [uncultured Methanomethylovorans sp.]|uniref:DUF6414 family protein n=1 Tax=uncultured Methanomethylovorans sp. TaxID=183759 RepID=UPI002AA741BF|nr:peptidylprolyl isomerase [uncultured Methanomethylovorans sp.]